MPQFPLYSTLITNLPKKDLTVLEKKEFIESIPVLDQEAHELIYALIKSYYLEHNGDLGLPYHCQIQKDGITFSLLDLPIELRRMLYKFIAVHNKKLQEDQIIHGSPI